MEVLVADEAQPAKISGGRAQTVAVELIRRRVRMLDPTAAAPHHEKRVVPVRHIAHQLRGRRHHALQVRHHPRPVHVFLHVLDGYVMGHALHGELQIFLVAHQNRAIVQHVEALGGKHAGFAFHRFQARRDLFPVRRRLEGHRNGMLHLARHVYEDSRWRQIRPVLAHIGVRRERGGAEHIVVQHDDRRVPGNHAPGVFGGLLKRKGASGAVFRAEVRHVPRVVADPVVARRPRRHFKILQFTLESVAAKSHV